MVRLGVACAAALLALATCCQAQGDLGIFADVFQTVCVPPEADPIRSACETSPVTTCSEAKEPGPDDKYYFDQTTGSCRRYSSPSCCNAAEGGNCFESIQECVLGCVPRCQQPAPDNDGQCLPTSSSVFFFDGESCASVQWDGCKTTNNIFENQAECSSSCAAGESQVVERENARQARQAAGPVDQFCQDFKERDPTKAVNLQNKILGGDVINLAVSPVATPPPSEATSTKPTAAEDPTEATEEPSAETTEEPQTPTEELGTPNTTEEVRPTERTIVARTTAPAAAPPAPPSTCERLRCVRQTVASRSTLNWVSVYARQDCIEVVMRLNCRRGLFRRPNGTELTRLCGLVKSGIERYWSRSVTHECNGQTVTTNVRIRVQLVNRLLALNAKEVVVKVYQKDPIIGNDRSHNSDILPMTMKFNYATHSTNPMFFNDIFEETAAHEVGHSILRAARGVSHSWTHKGTSTWYGKRLNQNRQPPSGEIDIMKYFAPSRRGDWKARTTAIEEDVLFLIDEAKFSYCSDEPCGQDLAHPVGHPCFADSECASSRCQFFRCVECTSHKHCPMGEHCAHRLKFWKPNRCVAALEHGKPCLHDRQCQSGRCHGLRCGECETDSHCSNGQFCSGRNLLFLQANRCKARKDHGSVCSRDRECSSGRCHGFRCGDCENDNHCPRGQFCSGRNLPLVRANRCKAGKDHGSVCSRDRECSSGRCHGLRCGECKNDGHCRRGQYCSGKNLPLLQANRCAAGKGIGGSCIRDAQCANRKCHGLRCGECERDSDCPAGRQCSGLLVPGDINRCRARLSNGALCIRNTQCSSGHCHVGRCGECEDHNHCAANEFCAGKNFGIFQANVCKTRLRVGAFCASSRSCSTGFCVGGRCSECKEDSHCPNTHYCSGLPLVQYKRCKARKCTGFCSRKRHCKSNRCKWYGRCNSC